ncbi:hypothetical protein [Burkholderia latens]|uniref:hypothetical protein n=1 Tax=Burkholderia latens TaxID=488446 RepID=UPI001ABBAD32|nr:hypothetical protein [Burkholderia latens]
MLTINHVAARPNFERVCAPRLIGDRYAARLSKKSRIKGERLLAGHLHARSKIVVQRIQQKSQRRSVREALTNNAQALLHH